MFRTILLCVLLSAGTAAAQFEVTVHAVPLQDKAGVQCFGDPTKNDVLLCGMPWTEYRGPANDPAFPETGWYCDRTLSRREVFGGDVYAFVSQGICSFFGDVPEGWAAVTAKAWVCKNPEGNFLGDTWAMIRGFSYAQATVSNRGFGSHYTAPIVDAYRAGHQAGVAAFKGQCRQHGKDWVCGKQLGDVFHVGDALTAAVDYSPPPSSVPVNRGVYVSQAFRRAFADMLAATARGCTLK